MTTMRVVGECFFWYRLTRVFPDKFHRAVKRLCVYFCSHFTYTAINHCQTNHSTKNNSYNKQHLQRITIFTRWISCSHSRSSRSGSLTVCVTASSRYFSTLRWTIDSITSRSANTDVWNSSNDFHSSRIYIQHSIVFLGLNSNSHAGSIST